MMSPEMTADQALSLAYARANLRASFRAAYVFDSEFRGMVEASKEPLLTRIKLSWWREQGLKMPVPETAFGDASMQLAAHLPMVVALIDAWDAALDDGETPVTAAQRGLALFELGSAIAGLSLTQSAAQAAKGWGLADFAIRTQSADALCLAGQNLTKASLRDLGGVLKPLGVLAALSRRDVECGLGRVSTPGSPRRMLTALSFALFNR
jgi:15-cis-phytoene synthase